MGEYADDYLDYCLDRLWDELYDHPAYMSYYGRSVRKPKKKEPHRGLKTGPGDNIPLPKKANKWSH